MNKFKEKTAISIITCNRPEMFFESLNSVDPECADIFVVNAGDNFDISDEEIKEKYGVKEIIKGKRNPEPVGIAKNRAIRSMRHSGYEYLFLMEDDVRIKDNAAFQKYIETAADSGLWAGQLSYGRHGGVKGGNVSSDGKSKLIDSVEYDNSKVDLYPNSFQAFTLYHANTIKIIGYFDELYVNAAEHLDHYYNSFMNGLGSYFWYFPDIHESEKYLEDIDSDHGESVIRKSPDWKDNMQKAWELFRSKYGYYPTNVPRVSGETALERLNFIETHYSRKDLI